MGASPDTPPLRPAANAEDLSPTSEMLHDYQHHSSKSDSEHSEDILRRENDVLRAATSQTNTILLDLSLGAEVRYLSKSWQDIVGTPIKSIVHKPISEIIFGDDEDKEIFSRAIAVMLEEETSFLVRFTTRLGKLRNRIDTVNPSSASDAETLDDINAESGGSLPEQLSASNSVGAGRSADISSNENKGIPPIEDVFVEGHAETPQITIHHHEHVYEDILEDDLIELEGQGMLFKDGSKPTHTLWFLKPYIPPKPLNIALPSKLTELLGSGAVFLVSFLEELSDSILMNSNTVPAQPLELCRICERHIPVWYFERHCGACALESKAEEAVALCHEKLMDQRNEIATLISAYENWHSSSSSSSSSHSALLDSPKSPSTDPSSDTPYGLASASEPPLGYNEYPSTRSSGTGSVSPKQIPLKPSTKLTYKGYSLPTPGFLSPSEVPSLHLPAPGASTSGPSGPSGSPGALALSTSPPRSPKLMTSSPLSGGRGTLKSAASFNVPKKSPLRFLELLLELCDMALDIKSPEIRYGQRATYKESSDDPTYMHIHSPTSETRIHQVLDWSESNNSDSGLALLSEDTTRLARLKVDSVIRLGNVLMYSEKVRLEVERSVHTFIENTVDKTVRRMDNIAHSSDDEGKSEGTQNDGEDIEDDVEPADVDYSFDSNLGGQSKSEGTCTPKNSHAATDNYSDLGDNTVIIYDSKTPKNDASFSDTQNPQGNFFLNSYGGSKVPSFSHRSPSPNMGTLSPLEDESSSSKTLAQGLSGLSLDDAVSSDTSLKSPLSQDAHASQMECNAAAETPTSLLNFPSSVKAGAIPISVSGHSSSRDYSSGSIGSTSPSLSFSSRDLKHPRPRTTESVSFPSLPSSSHEDSMTDFDLNNHLPSSPAVNIRRLQTRRSFGSSTASPRAFATSPLSGLNRGRLNSMSANTDGTFSPSSPMAFSPLIVPYDPERLHRRKSSTASDFSKGAISPLLTAATPTSKPSHPSIRDFEIICPISKGAFGSVYLSRKKLTGEYFAIKVLKKADMIAKNQVMNVKSERAIMMAQADSPFVAQLLFTFQNKDYLFLVMEYLNGGDCAGLIKALGGLSEEWCQQYLAEAVVAVDELHKRGIVHRDLKPENLLIDSKGHLKLIDFGLSRMGAAGRFTRDAESLVSRTNSDSSAVGLGLTTDTALMPPPPPPGLQQSLLSQQGYPSGDLADHATITSAESSNSGSVGSIGTKMASGAPLFDPSISFAPGYFNINGTRSKRNRRLSATGQNAYISESATDASSASSDHNSYHSPRSGSSNFNTSQKYALYGDRAKRFAGTPDYLAPETIKGSEQDDMSDWWSLGCILFEFLYGYPPFHDSTPEEVFQNILERRIKWPDPENEIVDDKPIASAEAKDLIDKLLTVDPKMRLGAQGVDEIKQHPFFSNISNWDSLWDDEASFIPRKVHPESTEYFDARGAVMEEFANEMNLEDADGNMRQSNSNHDSGDEFSSGGGTAPSRSNTESPLSRENRPGPKFLPLHIPPHVREGRSRRLSDTSAGTDFGLFSFKNVPVLDKANKELINKMKQEGIEREGRLRASFSSNTKSGSFSATFSSGSTPSSGESRQTSPVRQSSTGSNSGSGPSGGGATAIRLSSSSGSNASGAGPGAVSPLKIPTNKVSDASDHVSSPSDAGSFASPMKSNRRLSTMESSPDSVDHFRHSMARATTSPGSNPYDVFTGASDDSSRTNSALLRVQKRRQLSRKASRSSGSLVRNSSDGSNIPVLDIFVCYSNPVWRYSIERMLVRVGCRVVSVSSGQEAIRRVTGDVKFDLIILEIKLGKMQAGDVARLIHNTQNINLDTPIVTVSTMAAEDASNMDSFSVFSGIITKPPTEEKLVAELQRHYPDWKPRHSKKQ